MSTLKKERVFVQDVSPVRPKVTALPLEGNGDRNCLSSRLDLSVAEEVHFIAVLNSEMFFSALPGSLLVLVAGLRLRIVVPISEPSFHKG